VEFRKAVHKFTDDCQAMLAAIAFKREPTKAEVWLIQFYCKRVLSKIEPYQPPQSSKKG